MTGSAAGPCLERWAETLGRQGDSPAVFDRRGAVARTFSAVEEEARALGSRLEKAGPPGSVVAIQTGNHPAWPALLLACWRKGLVVLPLEQTVSPAERDRACAACGVALIVTGPDDLQFAPCPGGNAPPPWEGEAPALLKLTSGTTAAPRAIRFRGRQLLADCDQICATMGITAQDRNFGVIPVSHSYGFSNLLTPLLFRGVPLVLSRDRMPRAVLDDLAASGATVFPGMPVFFQPFCEMENVPPLPHLRLCLSAGAPLTARLAHAFLERFGQPIHSFYGSSECGGICYDRDGTNPADGFVGTPLEGVTIELADGGATTSQIRVRSAAVAEGYYPEPDPAHLGEGVFVPGDLLEKRGDGLPDRGAGVRRDQRGGKEGEPGGGGGGVAAVSRGARGGGVRAGLGGAQRRGGGLRGGEEPG